MNNKERIKQKQLAKKKAKEEKEKIIDKYIAETDNILNEQFKKIDDVFVETVRALDEGYVMYEQMLLEVSEIVKDETNIDVNKLEAKLKAMSEFVKELDNKITNKNKDDKNKIVSLAVETNERVQAVLEKANNNLAGNVNQYYIISLMFTRCKKLMNEYIFYTTDKIDEINSYINMYADSRVSFVSHLKDVLDKLSSMEEESFNDLERSNERLRVEYKQLKKFLVYKGYEFDRQKASTHAIWKNPTTGKSVPLPNKSKTVPQGTVSSLLRKIDSNRNELIEFLNS